MAAAIVVAACAGSFFGGTLYGKGQSQSAGAATVAAGAAAPGQGGQAATGQAGRGAGQGGMLAGVVQSAADGIMTISDSTGKLIQVKVTDTTLIQKQASVALSDLAKGDTVFVSASQGTDGAYTARSVQVANVADSASLTGEQPAGGNFPGGGGNTPGGNFPAGGGLPPFGTRP
jgi:hypothetical protein